MAGRIATREVGLSRVRTASTAAFCTRGSRLVRTAVPGDPSMVFNVLTAFLEPSTTMIWVAGTPARSFWKVSCSPPLPTASPGL